MKKIVENTDLGIPYTTLLNKVIVRLSKSILGIDKINRLYDKASDKEGVAFAEAILEELEVRVETDTKRLDFIPRKGAFVLVANHPHGALDGLLLMVLVAKIRPDVKFLGNFLLTQIDALRDFFMTVDSFDVANNGSNIKGIRKVVQHIQSGAPLIIFPAVEVSTDHKLFGRIEDKQWSESIIKLILKSKVPVIPTYIDGRNSLVFRILGRMSPVLGGVRLLHELTNKKGWSVAVAFGSAISVKRLQGISDVNKVSDFIRVNVYCLRAVLLDNRIFVEEKERERELQRVELIRKNESKKRAKQLKENKKEISTPEKPQKPIGSLLLSRELDSIAATRMLIRIGNLCLFCAPASEIPLTMREIARLRSATFSDLDYHERALDVNGEEYDDLYEHLFVWDAKKQLIAGGYRIGFGDILMDYRGAEGFHTYISFEFSRHLNDTLRHSIEIGLSFVVENYKNKPQILLLLWRGVLQVLLRNPSYRYLIGMANIPGDYTMAAKWLLIDYIKTTHWNEEFAKYVVPRNSTLQLGKPSVDMNLIRGEVSMDNVDKLIRDVEPSRQGIPLLLKKYLQVGHVMGFNVDPSLNDTLGVMLILDLCDVSKETIDIMAREFPEEDVYERFRAAGNTVLYEDS